MGLSNDMNEIQSATGGVDTICILPEQLETPKSLEASVLTIRRLVNTRNLLPRQ
jgi:hypothetical protein